MNANRIRTDTTESGKPENKTEMVPVPPYGQRQDGWQDQALAPFCVDGWWPRQGDITNHHCSFSANGQDYQQVVFFRNVQKGEVANAQTSSETQD